MTEPLVPEPVSLDLDGIGGDQFIHAPSERGVVRVESLSQQYWASRFIGAKRVS